MNRTNMTTGLFLTFLILTVGSVLVQSGFTAMGIIFLGFYLFLAILMAVDYYLINK